MLRSSSHLRNVAAYLRAREPITEPSGAGAFAEAMRELIAELEPAPLAGRLCLQKPANGSASGVRARHLRLVHRAD